MSTNSVKYLPCWIVLNLNTRNLCFKLPLLQVLTFGNKKIRTSIIILLKLQKHHCKGVCMKDPSE